MRPVITDGRCESCGQAINGNKGRHTIDACRICGEHLHDAESAAHCFMKHPLPPTRPGIVAEIVATSTSQREARARIARVDAFLAGIAPDRPEAS
jgi:hypothetical protein